MDQVESRPLRLQLSRRAGFDLAAASRAINGLGGASIARPTEWGNTFRVSKLAYSGKDEGKIEWAVETNTGMWRFATRPEAVEAAVSLYTKWIALPQHAKLCARARATLALRGANLFCWCPAGTPCHGDVLIDLVNQ